MTRGRPENIRSDTDDEKRIRHCQLCNAVLCALLGLTILILSCLILKDEKLQIATYVEPFDNNRVSLRYNVPMPRYPDTLRGCTAVTIAASVVQIVSSLMIIFGDLSVNVWKWMKFTVFMVSATAAGLAAKEDYREIQLYNSYYISLVVNSVLCPIFIVCDLY